MLSGLTLKSLTHFQFIFLCDIRKWPFHSFVCSCPVFPTPFIEETVLSPVCSVASLVIDSLMLCSFALDVFRLRKVRSKLSGQVNMGLGATLCLMSNLNHEQNPELYNQYDQVSGSS